MKTIHRHFMDFAYQQGTVSDLINAPLQNNYRSWVAHNENPEINVLIQVAYLLERHVVIRAKVWRT